ncbi:MAG TPA: DUF4175 family protein, partial [Stellaceae bacterium]|nr:DUF4175 family protein [Stellaceae bacterium]
MAKTAPAPESTPISRKNLARRVALARGALFWERCWPEFAFALGVIGLFLVGALFDLPSLVPGWLHAAVLAVLALLLAAALWRAVRALRLPAELEGRRRLEAASGLAHRPLAAVTDRLAGGAGDPVAMALWEAHRARMSSRLRGLRIGVPLAGFLRRDPYGLRAALAIVLLIGVLDAGRDSGERVLRALAPDLSFSPGAAASISLDIWITPPD